MGNQHTRHASIRDVHLRTFVSGAVLALALAGSTCSQSDQIDQGQSAAQQEQAEYVPARYSFTDRLPEDEIVYFMLPDRFNNGDPGNDTGGIDGGPLDHGYDPTHKGFYHGGDLKGLTEKLDYIQGLGATAIWLGPIFKNKPVQGAEPWISAGYHGYWITDFTSVDPHLGTKEDFKHFVESAHARGIKVYMDIITNHTADVIAYRECHDPEYEGDDKPQDFCRYRNKADYPYSTRGNIQGDRINEGFAGDEPQHQSSENFERILRADYAYTPYIPAGEEDVKVPAWLNDVKYYHNRGETHWSGEAETYGDFAGLDDLFTEHPVVVEGMIEIFKDWITEYRIDGFRVDTAKHVNPNFWKQFVPAIQTHAKSQGIENFYIFGEAYYDREPEMLAWQTREGGYDNVLDFAVSDAIIDISTGKNPLESFNKLFKMDDMYVDGYRTAISNPTFIGNHDKGRLSGMIKAANPEISQEELLDRVRLAHQLLIFLRGAPVIYAGDEQGFVSDGNDQLAREDMFPSRVDVYNDNNLIGTDATTADDNFDTNHPLYVAIRKSAQIRKDHKAIRRGRLIPRLLQEDGQILAFSRIDPDTGHEYLIAANTGPIAQSVNIGIDSSTETFTSLLGNCPDSVITTGTVSLNLAPFEINVCKANQPSSLFEDAK